MTFNILLPSKYNAKLVSQKKKNEKKKRGIMPSLHDLQKMWQWQLQSRSQTLAWKTMLWISFEVGD